MDLQNPMVHKPITAIWEVTMGCNMRCGHCGSSCDERLPDELNTKEALDLVDQIADMGLRWITLSGGEPFIRKDLPLIVQRFTLRSVAVNIITNGWLVDSSLAGELKASGVSTVAISIDGTKKVHDSIRKSGSFLRLCNAITHLRSNGVAMGAVTTISNKNWHTLPELRKILIDLGVQSWQVQLGFPMGNFKERPDWVIDPEQVPAVIDFCYETSMEGGIKIFPADCFGYYTEKELIVRQNSGIGNLVSVWSGCHAGVRSFGILHNGDILGCTSIREKSFVEGNIRNLPLAEIWCNPENFAWRREMSKELLLGDCAICIYGSRCLGGCPNTRLTMNGDIYSENQYCAYNLAIKELREHLMQESDTQWLITQAKQSIEKSDFQTAAFFADRALTLEAENKRALAMKGYAEFMCGNYSLCESANRKILELEPGDVYAMKGLGLALHMSGDKEQGLSYVEQAAKMTGYADEDIMNDLAFVRGETSK